MKPISDRLLVHSATAKTVTGKDADRNPTYSEETALAKIRIVTKRSVTLNDTGLTRTDTMLLLFDCIKSTPSGFVPEENMVIVFGGNSYTVRSVTPCYAGNTGAIHHYKAELV